MTSLNFVLYSSCLFLWRTALATNSQSSLHVRQDTRFISANVGDSVTLRCVYDGEIAAMFYWYKQTLEGELKLISTFYKHDKIGTFSGEFKDNPRFSLEGKKSKNHLTISDLQISDSATYYCVGCETYTFEFGEGTTISVKSSGLDIKAYVHQSASETIQPGGSVTLNCTVHTGTCDGEHSVYWFKNQEEEESHPGLIYTHGGRNDQCERKPDTQTHTCVYNLPMKSLNLSHAGTYYCAVVSCGEILFGNGTKLDFTGEVNSPDFLVHFLSGALAFTTALTVLLAFSLCMMKRRNHWQCTAESQVRVSASATADEEDYQGAENLHYAALRNQRSNRTAQQRDDQCVYSSVRQ